MEKLTNKQIKSLSYGGEVYYTDQNENTLKYFHKLGYNSGVYGWNFDAYEFGYSVLLVGCRVPSYAKYIDSSKVEKVAIETLEEKIASLPRVKERLEREIKELKSNEKSA